MNYDEDLVKELDYAWYLFRCAQNFDPNWGDTFVPWFMSTQGLTGMYTKWGH